MSTPAAARPRYLLIQAPPGSAAEVVRRLRARPEVASAEVVTGAFDVVAAIGPVDEDAVHRVVTDLPRGCRVQACAFARPA